MSELNTAPEKLKAAAERLTWYAEKIGYVTDEHGEHHTMCPDAREALTLAEQINALGSDELR